MKLLKKLFILVLIPCLLLGTVSCAKKDAVLKKALESKHELRFDNEGNFKVMILADLHLQASGLPEGMREAIKTLVDRENPNLIIFTGDNIADAAVNSDKILRATLQEAVSYIEEKKIPWMHVFGNHDAEHSYTREQQQAVYESFDYCISKRGDEGLTGVGNYVLPVYGTDDTVKFAVWGLDSGDYLSAEEKEALFPTGSTFADYGGTSYDYIHRDQIEWYVDISKRLQAANDGTPVPGLMAFHIPLQETYTAWANRESLPHTGEKKESVASSAYNSGLFAVLHARGDIKAVVNGHDHVNDFMVEYGGIKLCYSSTISTNTYHDATMLGSRVFVIHEQSPSDIQTYMSYLNK